jgi:uncharacterized protein
MLSLSRKALLPFLSVIILAAFVGAIPAAVPPVNGQVISDDWKSDIESYLLEVDKNTTAEIVIYVLDSLYGHGITKDGSEINDKVQLGVYIFNELPLDTPSGPVVGIGKKGKDNGVLVLVAMEDREWRIEVGYGLEGYITDAESYRIAQNEYLVPKFQEGKYCEGLKSTVEALAKEIPNVDKTEQMPTRGRYVYDNAEPPADEEIPPWIIALIVILVIVMISVGSRLGGGRIGRWGGRGGGGGRSGGGGGGGGGRSGGGGSGGRW